MGRYTRGEVVWLLSMTRSQAIEQDACQRDSCAGLSDDLDIHGGSGGEPQVPVIARWWDVQAARSKVREEKEELAVLQLRAGGFSERELGRLGDHSRLAVRRRFHASVDEILERLGGPRDEDETLSHVDLCLRCGRWPRVRLAAVRVRTRGGWRTVEPGRMASVCVAHLAPELHARIMQGGLAAA